MKYLLISEIFPPKVGGSGKWFWEIYSRLPADRVVIAAGMHDGSSVFDSSHSLRTVRWPLSLRTWGICSIEGIRDYVLLLKKLYELIKGEGITSIHCGRTLPEGVLGLVASKCLGIPYLCYVHGEELNTFKKSRELTWLSRHVLTSAGCVIANTQNTRTLIQEHASVDNIAIKVLHPGVDVSWYKPAAHNSSVKQKLMWQGRKVVLSVGRLQKRKGNDLTILAINAVREKIPEVLYVIVGDGEERPSLLNLVEKEKVSSHVQFMGEVDDETLRQCYQQCDVFILANRDVDGDIEGFGMVLVEAQACGKTVIAGLSGGTSETMLAGCTGNLVDCSSSAEIAKALVEILGDEEKRADMGKKAAEWTHETFDWQRLVQKAEATFEIVKPA